jgi:hypothetical protein
MFKRGSEKFIRILPNILCAIQLVYTIYMHVHQDVSL